MDFRVPQEDGFHFMYVLPYSETCALIESTVYSDTMLNPQWYENQITKYLTNVIQCKSWDVVNKEQRLKSILDCNIGNELNKLKHPKLFINALDDKLMKVYHGIELQKICNNSELITLNSGGHMLTETRTNDLIKHIKKFLNSIGR